MIGVLFSDVILEIASPDEDWRLGSTGWIDKNGVWKPSRGRDGSSLAAREQHARRLAGRASRRPSGTDALATEKTALEAILLSPGVWPDLQ